MKIGRTLQDLAIEIERQQNSKRDLVASTDAIEMGTDWDVFEPAKININAGSERFLPNDHFHRQIGSYLDIPAAYYDRTRAQHPKLLATSVNTWMADKRERRMIRTLDGTARAFLSDKYQRIDNYDVLNVALPILGEEARSGLQIVSCEVTERRLYIKATTSRLQGEVKKGDVIQAGVLISNSEIGQGAVTVQPLLYQLVCLNGMVRDQGAFRKMHVGGRVDIGDDLSRFLADDTLRADDHAILLKVRDAVRAAMDPALFNDAMNKMRGLAEARVADPVKAVEVLGNQHSLLESEKSSVLRHLIEGADLSLWGLQNAVTRMAQDAELTYDRASELEQLGGKLIDLPAASWNEVRLAA